jgi:hypothetical protein
MIEAIEKLRRLEGARFSEVCEKHTFECYRMRVDGCMQEVTIVVLDAGPDADGRYYCHAKTAEGREISSSVEATLDAAFASMRWDALDPEPEPAASDHPAVGTDAPSGSAESASTMSSEYNRRALFDRLRKTIQG